MLLLTQSRTGLLVAGLEVGAWWWTSRRGAAPVVVKSATQTGRRGEGEDGLDRIDKIDRIVEGGAPRLSNPVNPVNPVRKTPCLPSSVASALNAIGMPVLFAGALVLAARCVPPGNAPRVQGGYAASGTAPRALALYDDSWSLRVVRARAGADARSSPPPRPRRSALSGGRTTRAAFFPAHGSTWSSRTRSTRTRSPVCGDGRGVGCTHFVFSPKRVNCHGLQMIDFSRR